MRRLNVNLQLLVCLLGVEADRLDGGDHHRHAEGDGDEQHDDVFGSILQSQLLLVCIHFLIRAAAAAAAVCSSRTRPPAQPLLDQQRRSASAAGNKTRDFSMKLKSHVLVMLLSLQDYFEIMSKIFWTKIKYLVALRTSVHSP